MASTVPRGSRRGFRGRASPHPTTRPSRGGGARPPDLTVANPKPLRPTHFLAIPLNNHPALRDRISLFQAGLMANQPPIPGLDSSIIIDPRRMHITLGVMHLEPDIPPASHARTPVSGQESSHTLSTALDLLRSLQPQLIQISQLIGTRLAITLDTMDIFRPERNFGGAGGLGASVLFIGSSSKNDRRLQDICDTVHRTFKQHGYITEKRPLKLHCSILNTSHRKPRRRQPFSYSDILNSHALRTLIPLPSGSDYPTGPAGTVPANPSGEPATRNTRPEPSVVHVPDRVNAVDVNLGTWEVNRVELWIMGSHGPNNEYISCGGIGLDRMER